MRRLSIRRTRGSMEMEGTLSKATLVRENQHFRGTGGRSEENRREHPQER